MYCWLKYTFRKFFWKSVFQIALLKEFLVQYVCFFLFVWYLFIYFLTVVQLQLSAFSPHPSTPPLGFVHVSFIVVPENASPHCPLPTPPCLSLR